MEYKTNMNKEKTAVGTRVLKVAAKVVVPLSVFYLAISAPGCEKNTAKPLKEEGAKNNSELYVPYSVSKKDPMKEIDRMVEALETNLSSEVKSGRQNRGEAAAAAYRYELYVPYSVSNQDSMKEIDRMVRALETPLNTQIKK